MAHVRLVSCSREACEGIESVRRVAAWTALPPCGCVGLRALRCAAASALRCATATAVELTALTRLGAHVASDALVIAFTSRERGRDEWCALPRDQWHTSGWHNPCPPVPMERVPMERVPMKPVPMEPVPMELAIPEVRGLEERRSRLGLHHC